MSLSSTSVRSFLSQPVTSTRRYVYWQQFPAFFFLGLAIAGNAFQTAFDHPFRVLGIALIPALLVCVSRYWADRHGHGTRAELAVLVIILLALLGMIAWRELR